MTDGVLERTIAETGAALPLRPLRAAPVARRVHAAPRPRVEGKFIFVGEQKLYIRGVTYGPFRPGPDGCQYGSRARVEADFAQMRDSGFNAVRVYTVPPRWLLDLALENGLYVMVGLPWEQHVAFLDSGARRREISQRVSQAVRACVKHPAVLCYVVGNEIPAQIVRWYGARRVERWIKHLYDLAKQADPGALVTYVNYPSTEYLHLPFLDFVSFNVYLETPEKLRRYLARLQNISGDRPLVMAEVGLDALRNGEEKQAETLAWQISTAMSYGCGGVFIFAWTDEWHRGGHDILDWKFGLTDVERQARPALSAVAGEFERTPFHAGIEWPRVSVIVCTYNGSRTLEECLEGLSRVDYPDFEIIVVDDGSTDRSASIAERFDVRLIRTSNGGLSNARNIGLHAATGQIVAYLDDDAYPDRHWLKYLAWAFLSSDHAGIGGPNIPPPSDGPVADCVAHAPGGPTHVLLSDSTAEHIPGCNMAFRRDRLLSIGGFDPQFCIAGDDVDVCWRMHERGWTLGFSPAAVVWHHRRGCIRAYFRQQLNYGRAEALLERKWPEKYNAAGHLIWSGRLYGKGYLELPRLGRRRIYHGTWGTALFQSVYHSSPSLLSALPTMPEWYLLIGVLSILSLFALVFPPLVWAAPLALGAVLVSLLCAMVSGMRAPLHQTGRSRALRWHCRATVILLHLLHPVVRLTGRLNFGLTPWRLRGVSGFALPRIHACTVWSEQWRSSEERLAAIEDTLRDKGAVVVRGGSFDRWDLELRGGMLGGTRLHMTLEEHGAGKQLARFRVWPRCAGLVLCGAVTLGLASVGAATQGLSTLSAATAISAALLIAVSLRESTAALATMLRGLRSEDRH